LAGLPGVGKSTLARSLAARFDAYVLDKDDIRDAIFPAAERDYSDEQNELATRVMLMVAEYVLKRDPTKRVILDGKPFSRQDQRDEARRVAERSRTPFRLIHCVAADEVVRRRLAIDLRDDPRSVAGDRTFAKYRRIKAVFEPIRAPHLVVDTGGDPAAAVERCLVYLRAAADQPAGLES
jgi:predicted kinase